MCGADPHNLKISSKKNLKTYLVHFINQKLANDALFTELNMHDLEHEILTEDMHSSQLFKKIVKKYLTLRLHSYGQLYTRFLVIEYSN